VGADGRAGKEIMSRERGEVTPKPAGPNGESAGRPAGEELADGRIPRVGLKFQDEPVPLETVADVGGVIPLAAVDPDGLRNRLAQVVLAADFVHGVEPRRGQEDGEL